MSFRRVIFCKAIPLLALDGLVKASKEGFKPVGVSSIVSVVVTPYV